MIHGIYQIRNKVNSKCYVGSSTDIESRCKEHLYSLYRSDHPNRYLQHAWDKYGEKNFEFLIIEEQKDVLKLILREQYYIDELKPEYNLSPTAGSPLGYKHTKKVRDEMSQKLKESYTPERRQKISKAFKGITKTPEHRQKISDALKGVPKSLEHCQKISKARKGVPLSPEHRRKIGDAHKGVPELQTPKRRQEINRKISKSLKGHIPWNKEKVNCYSKETIKKMSEIRKKYWIHRREKERSVI